MDFCLTFIQRPTLSLVSCATLPRCPASEAIATTTSKSRHTPAPRRPSRRMKSPSPTAATPLLRNRALLTRTRTYRPRSTSVRRRSRFHSIAPARRAPSQTDIRPMEGVRGPAGNILKAGKHGTDILKTVSF